jgi:hypothetical protein
LDANYGAAFSPDGRLLATWSAGKVRLWDGTTGAARPGEPLHHPADVVAVRIDSQNHTLAAAVADGRVRHLTPPGPAAGSAADLAARLHVRTGSRMSGGTVSPFLPADWAKLPGRPSDFGQTAP